MTNFPVLRTRPQFGWASNDLYRHLFGSQSDDKGGGFSPATDVVESDSAYEIMVELPGVGRDDVQIEVADNVLSISGERKSEYDDNSEGVRRSERSYGKFERSFCLASNLSGGDISAAYADGVLKVSVPKPEEAQPKQVEIN